MLDGVATDPIFADQRFSPDLYWWCDGVLRLLPTVKTPAGPGSRPVSSPGLPARVGLAPRRGCVLPRASAVRHGFGHGRRTR